MSFRNGSKKDNKDTKLYYSFGQKKQIFKNTGNGCF